MTRDRPERPGAPLRLPPTVVRRRDPAECPHPAPREIAEVMERPVVAGPDGVPRRKGPKVAVLKGFCGECLTVVERRTAPGVYGPWQVAPDAREAG